MSTHGFRDPLLLTLLVTWLGLGMIRLAILYGRGVSVVVADRRRTVVQGGSDLAAGACLGVWWYELIAYATPLDFHIVPAWLRIVLVDGAPAYWIGVTLWVVAILFYALGVLSMGDSWRIGIDRVTPGSLITRGVFGYSRNPIYVSFDLAALATFAATGELQFLLLFAALAPLLHDQIRREEMFLRETYGEAYADYCRRVRRYL